MYRSLAEVKMGMNVLVMMKERESDEKGVCFAKGEKEVEEIKERNKCVELSLK